MSSIDDITLGDIVRSFPRTNEERTTCLERVEAEYRELYPILNYYFIMKPENYLSDLKIGSVIRYSFKQDKLSCVCRVVLVKYTPDKTRVKEIKLISATLNDESSAWYIYPDMYYIFEYDIHSTKFKRMTCRDGKTESERDMDEINKIDKLNTARGISQIMRSDVIRSMAKNKDISDNDAFLTEQRRKLEQIEVSRSNYNPAKHASVKTVSVKSASIKTEPTIAPPKVENGQVMISVNRATKQRLVGLRGNTLDLQKIAKHYPDIAASVITERNNEANNDRSYKNIANIGSLLEDRSIAKPNAKPKTVHTGRRSNKRVITDTESTSTGSTSGSTDGSTDGYTDGSTDGSASSTSDTSSSDSS